ncbi:MAG: type II toxin-antitoxin system HicA family toxin [Verrucomicrobiota bacterium]
MNRKKLFKKLLSGSKNIRFAEVKSVAEAVGFELERVNGSHHIFSHPNIPELLNLQNYKGQAKPYQISQLLKLIERHDLTVDDLES